MLLKGKERLDAIEKSLISAERQEQFTKYEGEHFSVFNENAYLHDCFFEGVSCADDIEKCYEEYLKELPKQASGKGYVTIVPELSDYERALNITKNFVLSNDDLTGMKCIELSALCEKYGLSKTGKKAELISRLNEYKSLFLHYKEELEKVNTIPELIDFLYRSGKIDGICHHIIRKIAGSNNQQSSACADIVKNNFRDCLYDDIKQDISITLFNMFKNNECSFSWDTALLGFKTIIVNDKEVSSYIRFYQSLRQTIATYKYESRNKADDIDNNTGYKQEDLFDILNSQNDTVLFFKWLKEQDKKNYSDFISIVGMLFEDMDLSDIAKAMDVSVRRVKYLKEKLFGLACDYYSIHGNYEVHHIEYVKRADKSKSSTIIKKTQKGYIDKVSRKSIDIADTDTWHTTKKGVRIYKKDYLIRLGKGYKIHTVKAPKATKLSLLVPENNCISWNDGFKDYINPYGVTGTVKGNVRKYGDIKGLKKRQVIVTYHKTVRIEKTIG